MPISPWKLLGFVVSQVTRIYGKGNYLVVIIDSLIPHPLPGGGYTLSWSGTSAILEW